MITEQVLKNAAFVGSSAVQYPQYYPSDDGLWQVEITGTATVSISGRIDSTAPWQTLATRSATGSDVIPIFPQMIVDVTSYTSGVVNAWLATRPN